MRKDMVCFSGELQEDSSEPAHTLRFSASARPNGRMGDLVPICQKRGGICEHETF